MTDGFVHDFSRLTARELLILAKYCKAVLQFRFLFHKWNAIGQLFPNQSVVLMVHVLRELAVRDFKLMFFIVIRKCAFHRHNAVVLNHCMLRP